MSFHTSIPSPTVSFFMIGNYAIHFYALFILFGIALAVVIGDLRLRSRGAEKWVVIDIALWTVPFGLIGGRAFHVVTHWLDYFGPGKDVWSIFYIWEGGLAIYGALILGAVGAFIGCRQAGIKFLSFADAIAPGVLLAQGIGRWGNFFNQELFGQPTDLPWGITIKQPNPAFPSGLAATQAFHPTFFYEFLWDVVIAIVLLGLDKRLQLRWGRMFASYLALYSLGRFWIEGLRIDVSDVFLGLRTNQWSALLGVALGLALLIWSRRNHTGTETSVLTAKGVQMAAENATEEAPAEDEK